jgi:hypothetical protein
MSSIVSGPVHFAEIPDELWNHPPSVNWTMALERMEQMENDGIAKSGRIGSGFSSLIFLKLVLTMSFHLGITICVDSTLGCDLPASCSRADRPVLTILVRNSTTTHYYKIIATIGASSAFSFLH